MATLRILNSQGKYTRCPWHSEVRCISLDVASNDDFRYVPNLLNTSENGAANYFQFAFWSFCPPIPRRQAEGLKQRRGCWALVAQWVEERHSETKWFVVRLSCGVTFLHFLKKYPPQLSEAFYVNKITTKKVATKETWFTNFIALSRHDTSRGNVHRFHPNFDQRGYLRRGSLTWGWFLNYRLITVGYGRCGWVKVTHPCLPEPTVIRHNQSKI